MNERIKELAEQSLCIKGGEFSFNGGEVELVDLKKFAELIIWECAAFLRDTMGDDFAAEQMKEHFGVES